MFVFQLVIEPSAAVPVAALLSEQAKKLDPSIKNIGVVLCGGNVDVDDLPWMNNIGKQWLQTNLNKTVAILQTSFSNAFCLR